MVRGIALIVAAVVLGVVLLDATDDPEPFVAGDDAATTTTTAAAGDEGEGDAGASSTTVAPRDPATVTVLVANGSGVPGAAGRLTEQVAAASYATAPPANVRAGVDVAASVVHFVPGFEAEARAVAGLFTPAPAVEPMPDPPPVDDLRGAQVLVVAAEDLAGS